MGITSAAPKVVEAVKRQTQLELQGVFPWLHWNSATYLTMPSDGKTWSVEDLRPSEWIVSSHGLEDFSFGTPWDSEADQFLSEMISSFMPMHAGTCCDVVGNSMQEIVESIHVYPHLSITKMTDGKQLIKA